MLVTPLNPIEILSKRDVKVYVFFFTNLYSRLYIFYKKYIKIRSTLF